MKIVVIIIRIKNNKTATSKSFDYKTKIIEIIPADNNTLDTEVVVPLNYLSNFWRSLDLPLINCKIELGLPWSRKCVISEICRTPKVIANPNADPPNDNPRITSILTSHATFQMISTKPYVPVVTLSINDNITFLENIKQGFVRAISWNKYRSEIATQPNNNNLHYMIDPTFRNINYLFFHSKMVIMILQEIFVDKYYMPC